MLRQLLCPLAIAKLSSEKIGKTSIFNKHIFFFELETAIILLNFGNKSLVFQSISPQK
jgi:hypothetical protein